MASCRWIKRSAMKEKLAKARKCRRTENPESGSSRGASTEQAQLYDDLPEERSEALEDMPDDCDQFSESDSTDEDDVPVLDEEDVYAIARDWIASSDRSREVRRMVSTLLYGFIRSSTKKGIVAAANVADSVVGSSGKSIRKWLNELKSNDGNFLEYGRGKYLRISVMHDEDLKERLRSGSEPTPV